MLKIPYKKIKRILDVIFSLVLILLLIPIGLVISFLIWITDSNSIFVLSPKRLTGENMSEFRMYKFRTMIPNAHDEILNNPKLKDKKEVWLNNGGKLKISEDPRITKIGKILRRTDLDEIPQLINVLKGEMSLVGPRPMYLKEIENLSEEQKVMLKDIFSVKPGITGLWAVSGRNDINFKDRVKLEREYANGCSFSLDCKILLKTPYIVLTRKGAYE